MIADALTKDDIRRSNGALEELLRSGCLTLWEEDKELRRREVHFNRKFMSLLNHSTTVSQVIVD